MVATRNPVSPRPAGSPGPGRAGTMARIVIGKRAVDAAGRNPYATIPGGARQRTLAYRFGVNLVMYALTGNYKGDQVHVPAILERLGN